MAISLVRVYSLSALWGSDKDGMYGMSLMTFFGIFRKANMKKNKFGAPKKYKVSQ